MTPLAYFGIESSGFSLAVEPADPVPGRPVPVADLLDLPGRPPAGRRSGDGRPGHVRGAVPVRRPARLHGPAPARVPGGRARARARGGDRRSPPGAAAPRTVPVLQLPHRAGVRALPQLPAKAQGALRQLLAPAGPGVDDLPLLRGGRAGGLDPARAPPPRRRDRGRARRVRAPAGPRERRGGGRADRASEPHAERRRAALGRAARRELPARPRPPGARVPRPDRPPTAPLQPKGGRESRWTEP